MFNVKEFSYKQVQRQNELHRTSVTFIICRTLIGALLFPDLKKKVMEEKTFFPHLSVFLKLEELVVGRRMCNSHSFLRTNITHSCVT